MKKSTCLAGALALGFILPAVGLGTVSAAWAQNVASSQSDGPVAFVRDTGNAGQFEVQSGRLALTRSRHAAVRAYAGQTVTAADAMIDRVKVINHANVGGLMPDAVSSDQQVTLDRLAGLSGRDFDRAYMRSQIEVGGGLKRIFSDYGANGDSPEMRVYAVKAVSEYDAQLLQAHAIAGSL